MDERANENARPRDELERAQVPQTESKPHGQEDFGIDDAEATGPRMPSLRPYLDAGLQLIPLHRWDAKDARGRDRGKTPRDGAWGIREYDSGQVAAAAERDGTNVGVRLPASVMVLDVDPRNFGDGDSLLALMIDTGMDLRGVPHTATGSGGSHYWFSKPIDVQLLDSLEAYPGVEFKSLGRQVVAAGSTHPNGTPYRWTGDFDLRDLPELPESLLRLARRPVRSHGESAGLGELTVEQLAETLEQLDAEDFADHDEWLKLMMACHHATDGDARQEFIDWSTQDPRYQDHGWIIGRRWDSLHAESGSGGRPITVRYLHKVVQAAGGHVPNPTPEADFGEVDDVPVGDVASPVVERFNRDHFTVLHGGRFLVGREGKHPTLGYHQVEWFTDEAVRKFHNTRFVEVPKGNGSTLVPEGKFWTEHPRRRQYDCVVFDPSPKGARPTAYNLWRGWAIDPKAGDWSLMRRLVRDVLCGGDAESFDYVLRWAAFMVQNPHVPAEVAIVFKGKKGRGKGMFARALKDLAGQHGKQVASGEQLTGRFNDHLMDCICLFVDEAFWAGNKQAEGVLKNLITEPVLTFEAKGLPLVQGPNLLHVVMASNEEWVVPATEDERRFAVFEVSEQAYAALPEGFFTDLVDQRDSGGLAAMLHDLLRTDLTGWHPRKNVPRNEARGEQVLRSLCRQEPVVAYWYDALSRGALPYSIDATRDWSKAPQLLKEREKDAFTDAINERAATMRHARTREYSKRAVAQFLKEQGIDIATKVGGLRAWHIPTLAEAREMFERFIGTQIEWED